MNQVTLTLEQEIQSAAAMLNFLSSESTDLASYYFDSGASTLVTGLASDTTPATVVSALTKAEVTNGITMIQQLVNFFGNSSVTQGDYLLTVNNLINGSDVATSILSNDVENVGNRLKVLGENSLTLHKKGNLISSLYTASELSSILSSLSDQTIVYGANVSASKMLAGIVLLQQYLNFLNNASVTQGDYQSTVSQWL